jgi:hypothetical protein
MPSVALDVFEEPGTVVSDGTNPPVTLGQLRVFVWVKLGAETAHRQAVVDTGAPFTILPKQVWSALDQRRAVEWVAHPPGIGGRLPVIQIAGAPYDYRLGRVDVQVARLDGAELRPVPVLVLCVEDDPGDGRRRMKGRAVLGLAGGLLHGRRLTLEADDTGAKWSGSLVE